MQTVRMILGFISSFLGIAVSLLMLYQLLLSIFGFKRCKKDYQDHPAQKRFLVLVPAHNEETVIPDIIENLMHMEYPKELYDFYIIADNCTDRTEDVARQMGANVIALKKASPNSPTGKPIALNQALNILDGYQDKYDMLMIFDADNLIDPNMFLEVNSQYISENEPEFIQCYLGAKNKKGLVAWFYYTSYTITNRFFQLAKSRLGLNCTIGGTGFAVDTKYLYGRGGWTTMSLTEDFEIQVEATLEGKRILWNHNVRVYDEKPTSIWASYKQRTRWAQGHWFVTLRNTTKVFKALRRKRITSKEAVSILTYMYSLTANVVVVFQLFVSLVFRVMDMITEAGRQVAAAAVQAAASVEAVSSAPADGWVSTTISLGLLFYSFFLLFYSADWMDNKISMRIRTIPLMAISFVVNIILATCSQIVGLFRYRRQSQWVKTEHKIKRLEKGKERITARAKLLSSVDTEEDDVPVVKAGAK